MLDASQNSTLRVTTSERSTRFGWLHTWSTGRQESGAIRVGVVEACALIPEPNVRAALDSLVGEFRSVRSYRCRFRGDAANPNLDLISKDLRAALERLGHAVGRPTDGSRGVRWIEGSGDIAVDEGTVRALAPHVRAEGFVQINAGGAAWFWTFVDGTARRNDGRHPMAPVNSGPALTAVRRPTTASMKRSA